MTSTATNFLSSAVENSKELVNWLYQPENTEESTTPLKDKELIQKGWESQPEEFDYDLEVEGVIPAELRGTLFRNGPGLLDVYGTKLAHPIDGDGMISSISIENNKAHFRSKYVKTVAYAAEKKYQKAIFKGMMGTMPPKTWGESIGEWKEDIFRGRIPDQRFKNPSNTNVYYWGGKLVSCWESGMPYALNPSTLDTIGKDNIGGVLDRAKTLAAHFRVDVDKNRLVTFSLQLNMSGPSKLFFYEFDEHWTVQSEKMVELDQYYYCHDMLITPNYYIVHQSPFYSLDKKTIALVMSGIKAPGQLMKYYPEVPSRMIVIPRAADSTEGVRLLDIEPCHVYHHLNAYEENSKIFFSSVCLGENFRMDFEDGIALSNTSQEPGLLYNFTVDLLTNTITREKADESSCEFPTTNTDFDGKKWRYAYLMASDAPHRPVPYHEVIKFDREGTNRQVWSARGEYGAIGEPIFVPRPGGTEEDDGWVFVQVYHYKTHKTHIAILDAKNLSSGPVARLKLAHHTPFAFHGTFTPEIFGKSENREIRNVSLRSLL